MCEAEIIASSHLGISGPSEGREELAASRLFAVLHQILNTLRVRSHRVLVKQWAICTFKLKCEMIDASHLQPSPFW